MGVPVRLHFTFVLLLIFLMVFGLGSSQSPSTYIVYVLALLASVLLHEFAHAFASARCGIRTVEIVMFPIGGISRLERRAKPGQEFWIALAGPLVNIVIGGGIFWFLFAEKRIISFFTLSQPTDANLLER